jgi:hydroxymethylglutaryl-CoA reductase
MTNEKNSQLSKFYKKSITERQEIINEWLESVNSFTAYELTLENADQMTENVIGLFQLPLCIATNFRINNRDYLIPMVVEEPSVIAAASNAAKMFRDGGGFITTSSNPIMIGQMQILDVPNVDTAIEGLQANKANLIQKMNTIGGSIFTRGGGAKDIEYRVFKATPFGDMLIAHILYDTRDAMGANAVNTALEHIASDVAEITQGRVHLKILSNLADHRTARAEGIIPQATLATETMSGEAVIDAILEAAVFAEVDPYRATTHNKGIMNGIDPVVIATGNDWRAVEAAAHAFAARSGSYTSMTQWRKTPGGDLHGSLELPMAIGIVGGATRVHPGAQLALKILGVESARELAEVIVAVGLAQNFAAMRALSTEGIQRGHMRLHARQLAAAAGANVALIPRVAAKMIQENNIRLERAKELVQMLQEENPSQ